MSDEPIIAEATGYAGAGSGPIGPLIEAAMHNAVVEAAALGIADDTPAERVEELTGIAGIDGSQYIRDRKLAARSQVKEANRTLAALHEQNKAKDAHEGRDNA
jgi:hypothetical protein